mgnify:FL=1
MLKRTIRFRYRPTISFLIRVAPAAALMTGAVLLVKFLWPVSDGRGLLLILQFLVYAAVGGAVYLPLVYRWQVLSDVFGTKMMQRITGKLGIRKR